MLEKRRMKIAICASMVFAEEMVQVKRELEEIGHTAFISQFAEGHLLRVLGATFRHKRLHPTYSIVLNPAIFWMQ